MNFNLKYESPFDLKVTSSVPSSKIDSMFNEIYAALAQNTQVKGFRKKKIPINIIKTNFSNRAKIEVFKTLTNQVYGHLSSQRINIIELTDDLSSYTPMPEEGKEYKFTLSFKVQPMPKIKSKITGMVLDKPNISTITQEDIQRQIDIYRRAGNSKQIVENRTVQDYDIIVADILVELDGIYSKVLSKTPGAIHLTKQSCPQEMIDGLIGMKLSETRTINLNPKSDPDTYIDRVKRKYTVKLYKIVEISASQLDDNLAKKFNLDTVASLKDQARKMVEFENSIITRDNLKKQICDILLKEQTFEVAPKDVEAQKNLLKLNLSQSMQMYGVTNNEIEKQLKNMENELEKKSLNKCSLELIISQIIAELGITVTDRDIEEQIRQIHLREGIPLSNLKKRYSNKQARFSLEFSIAKERAFDHIISNAKFNQDSSGV